MSDIDEMIDRLTERQQLEFALSSTRRVQHLMRDPRSIAALDTRERWLRGEATDEEMDAAASAASDAARAATWFAASAASAAARAAEWAAAGAAERAAEWSASAAARDAAAADAARDVAAAYDAERAWQREELQRMLQGGGA